jgi:hypothetical protein
MESVVEVLAWLIIPAAALLLSSLWVAWASRPKPPADVHETLEDYERFKAALEGDAPKGRRKRA